MIRDDEFDLGGSGRLDNAKGLSLSFGKSKAAIGRMLEAVAFATSDSGEVASAMDWQGLGSNRAASCTSFILERIFTRPLIVSTIVESAAWSCCIDWRVARISQRME